MTLPTDRTTANTAAQHVADHNTLHAEHNVPTHTHSGAYEPEGAVATHSADTTSVHGIADTADVVIGDGITDIVALTQAAYDLLTPDATTLYVIVAA